VWLLVGLTIFGIAFAALFRFARRVYAHFDEGLLARRFIAILTILLLALIPLAGVLSTASDRMREQRLGAVVTAARPVLDAIARGAVGPLEGAGAAESVIALLRGREVRQQPSLHYEPLDLRQSGAERLSAEGNFPFLVMDRTLRPGEMLRFPIDRSDSVWKVAFAVPEREYVALPAIEVTVLGAGSERRVLSVDAGAIRYHGWGEIADLVEVRVADVSPPISAATAIEVRSRERSVPIHGVCYVGNGNAVHALLPEEHTRSGLPVRLVPGPAARGVPIKPGAPPVEFSFAEPVDCDRLWLVFEASDPKAAEYRWFGEDIIDVRLDYADGRPSEQHTLKHGEDVHSANLDRSRHAEDLQSSVAMIWDEDGVRSHADQRLWVFSGQRRLKRVVFRNLSGLSGYAVNLLGLTVGTVTKPAGESWDSGELATYFIREGDRIRLRPEMAERLRGAQVAVADRRGVIRQTEREGATHLVGASIDEPDLETLLSGRALAPRCASFVGIDADVAMIPLREGDVVSGSLVFFVPERDRDWRHGKFTFIPLVAALLAIPFFLVAFAESLSRGERIRRKITIALAVAAVVPVAVVFVIVRSAFEASQTTGSRQKLSAELQALRERFVREREVAANEAAAFFRNFREQGRVEPLFLPPPRPDAEATFRLALRDARARKLGTTPSFARLELRLPGVANSPWRTIDETVGGLSPEGADFQGTDYYCVHDRLALVGVDRWSQGELRGRLALGVEVAVPQESGRNVQLFGLDGTPLDGRPLQEPLTQTQLSQRIATARRSNRAVSLPGPWNGLVDVFRDRDGNPVFAFTALEPPGQGEIALFGLRTSLGTLLGIVTILGAVGALGVARILTDRITIPIERLAAASEDARLGRRVISITASATDEIGVLTERFQAMSSELVRRIEHLDDLQRGMLGFAARLKRDDVAREASRFVAVATRARLVWLLIPETQGRGWRTFDSEGKQKPMRMTPLLKRLLAADEWMTISDDGATPFDYLGFADRALIGANVAAVVGGPVRLGRRDEGWLLCHFDSTPDLGQREAARAAASAIAIVLENSRTYELAIEDTATGALVSHYFELRLIEAVERARTLGRSLWVVRWGILGNARGPIPAERAMRAMARRLVRFADRERSAFVGKTGPLELTIALEGTDPARRAALEKALRKVSDHLSQSSGGDAWIRFVAFPDDAPSAEAVLQRLRSGSPEYGMAPVDLEAFLGGPVPSSPSMRETVLRAARLARVDIPVLLTGEAGVGKEWLAQRMHNAGSPDGSPRITVHLGTLNPNLAEAELFGVEAGAFSGAETRRAGLLEQANGGTLVLEEVGETPLDVQAKILRALQERRVRRVGGTSEISVAFRLISTSTVDLKDLVRSGRLRQDFFYRIAGAELHVPPLRARTEDIPILALALLAEAEPQRSYTLAPRAIDRLMGHSWPGNLTELRGVLRRAVLFAGERSAIEADDIEIARVPLQPIGSVMARIGASSVAARARIPSEVLPEVRARQRSDAGPDFSWNERQRRLLAVLARGAKITTREYMEMMNVSPRTGLRDLDELVIRGRLRREGRKKGMSFRVI
jgi:DNA-binding NtrC family response regulator/HAMP domain-containing protein